MSKLAFISILTRYESFNKLPIIIQASATHLERLSLMRWIALLNESYLYHELGQS